MRIYRLVARVGWKKQRLYPWFDAPAAEAPKWYYGWFWDPAKREWVADVIAPISVVVDVPRYPVPTQTPRPEQPLYVEGWYWNGRAEVWEETTMPFEDVLVVPERGPMPEAVPSRAQPAEVPGWRYSFTRAAWEEISMVPYTEMQEMERGPMPKYIPGVERPPKAKGWSWSFEQSEWVPTIVMGERIGFTPPLPLPPDVKANDPLIADVYSVDVREVMNTLARAHEVFGPSRTYMLNQAMQMLLRSGFSRGEAERWFDIYASAVRKLPYGQAKELIAKATGDAFRIYRRLHVVSLTEGQNVWSVWVRDSANKWAGQAPAGVSPVLLGIAAAITGLIAGLVLNRLVTPTEEYFRMTGGMTTYLLGPDNWLYSKEVALSSGGRRYFSACTGIGTGYTRHKRGYGVGQTDFIDFPGGFVETGYKFPYWVKYTWEFWELAYVGMLANVGADLYVLKVGKYHKPTREVPIVTSPFQEWCSGFRFYL